MKHKIMQNFPLKKSSLIPPTQKEIYEEPNFRRATSDFVRSYGGDIARAFLQQVEFLGLISEQSRFMCQRSPLVAGAYSSPPNWHVDWMPGTPFDLNACVGTPIQGAMACFNSVDKIALTEFLDDGPVYLEMPPESSLGTGQYLQDVEGQLDWPTYQIEKQLSLANILSKQIDPNSIYSYDSKNFHRPPLMQISGGHRLIIRVNTPPTDFRYDLPVNNVLLEPSDFYFVYSADRMKWRKLEI